MSDKFNYIYTAPTESERREIEKIRSQYTTAGEKDDKLNRLRRLDSLVNFPAKAVAAIFAVAGVLTFGLGASLCLKWYEYVWGASLGAVGALVAAAAYPLYKWILRRNKRKFGAEIIKLSDELLKICGEKSSNNHK